MGEKTTALDIAFGIVIGSIILGVLGVAFSAAILKAGSEVIDQAVSDAENGKDTLATDTAAQRNAVLLRAAEAERLRQARILQTPHGRKLRRECDDWLKARADYDFPSTRQGVREHCGRLDRYLGSAYIQSVHRDLPN